MPTVTALRPSGRHVAVELDGRSWRTFPAAAVVEAGVMVGIALDRERIRQLARARRRARADEAAVRALSRRDRTRSELDSRLERVGVRPAERQETLERASRAGLVDDARFATARARTLAERGAGDLLVLDDLEQRGVDSEIAQEAVSQLEPEADRAVRILEARGRTRRTLRYLASRGFSPESLEPLIADAENGALP
jgi:regulatory protein